MLQCHEIQWWLHFRWLSLICCFQSSTFIHLLNYNFHLTLLFSLPKCNPMIIILLIVLCHNMWLKQQRPSNKLPKVPRSLIHPLLFPADLGVRDAPLSIHRKTWSFALALMSSPLVSSVKERREGGRRDDGRVGGEEGKKSFFFGYFHRENVLLLFHSQFTFLTDDARMAVSRLSFFISSTVN